MFVCSYKPKGWEFVIKGKNPGKTNLGVKASYNFMGVNIT